MGAARLVEEVQHVPLLFAGCVGHGHDTLSKSVAAVTLGAKASFAPKNKAAELLFSMVIRWRNTAMRYEGPQSIAVRENIGTRARDTVNGCVNGAL